MKHCLYIILAFCIGLISSCSTTKQVPANDALYTGAKIEIKPVDKTAKVKKGNTKSELESLLRPAPNKSFLGIPFKLLIYNMIDTPKKNKGLQYWLKYKVGEPPVLASSVNLEKNSAILQNRLENNGYFHSDVTFDTSIKHKKMKATYKVAIQQQYTIRNVFFPTDSGYIYTNLRQLSRRSMLRKGRAYSLDRVKAERERIDRRLKEKGFYYFSPEDIIVDVDSTVGNHQVDMYVRIKEGTPFRSLVHYRINDVVIFPNYTLNTDTSNVVLDSSNKFRGYYIIDPEEKFNPKILAQTVVFKPGDIYNRTAHATSLNRLVSLGVFKFVKAKFDDIDTSAKPLLNTYYYLTPLPKRSIRLEVGGLTKSNNATGTEVSLSWRNRNLFKGAELFTASVYGGFEKQISGTQSVNTLRGGVDLNLLVPRVIGPVIFKTNGNFVPQTAFNAGYEIFHRDTQYTLRSIRGSFGYNWKETATKEHQLKILSVNYVQPYNINPLYQSSELDHNITLARSIEKQFLIGTIYNFNLNTQNVPNRKKNNYFFNGNLDLSGNILGLITGANVNEGKQKKIFNTPFSQYVRLEGDFRHYLRVGRNNMLASRFFAGAGYAYGNSSTMPFIKEFFAGGTNSIRAFRARSLGPGTYYAGNAKDSFIADQPGDIRLEVNTELRFKIVSVIYGAAFVDAGNIWTFKNDPQRPGSKFTNKFLQQFAVGTGLGLRVDVKFFVIRLDAAFPIRKPFDPDDPTAPPSWVINKIDFSSSKWRRDNLVFNLAIGYPF